MKHLNFLTEKKLTLVLFLAFTLLNSCKKKEFSETIFHFSKYQNLYFDENEKRFVEIGVVQSSGTLKVNLDSVFIEVPKEDIYGAYKINDIIIRDSVIVKAKTDFQNILIIIKNKSIDLQYDNQKIKFVSEKDEKI